MNDDVLITTVYVLVKGSAYLWFLARVSRTSPASRRRLALLCSLRVVVGFVAGVALALSMFRINFHGGGDEPPSRTVFFLLLLTCLRALEWRLLLPWLPAWKEFEPRRRSRWIVLGVLVSFGSDVVWLAITFGLEPVLG